MKSCTFIIRHDAPRKDGTCLICLQTFIAGKRWVKALDIYCLKIEWDFNKQRVIFNPLGNLSRKNVSDFNLIITSASARANEIYIRYRLSNKPLSIDNFKAEFDTEFLYYDFYDFIEQEIDIMKQSGRDSSTTQQYLTTLKRLKAFQQKCLFIDLTFQFIEGFDNSLIKLNNTTNTRWKYHKTIKMFIARARKKKIIIDSPYLEFKVKKTKGNRIFLEAREVRILHQCYISNQLMPHLQETLRTFLFACFTGLRYSDLMKINHSNLLDKLLAFIPVKTRHIRTEPLVVPLNDTAYSLIIPNNHASNEPLFKNITPQYFNRNMKIIAMHLNIHKHLTTHIGRHTFAAQYLSNGGAVERLQNILGHSKIETTMEYVHILNDDKKSDIMKMDKIINYE